MFVHARNGQLFVYIIACDVGSLQGWGDVLIYHFCQQKDIVDFFFFRALPNAPCKTRAIFALGSFIFCSVAGILHLY